MLVVFTDTQIYLTYLVNLALPDLQVPAIWRPDQVGCHSNWMTSDLFGICSATEIVLLVLSAIYLVGLTLHFEIFWAIHSSAEPAWEQEGEGKPPDGEAEAKEGTWKLHSEFATYQCVEYTHPIQYYEWLFNSFNKDVFHYIARLAQTLDCQVVRNVKRRRLANCLLLSLILGHYKRFTRILLHQCAVFP